MPKYSTVFLLVENDKNLQTQTIQFNAIPAKTLGDVDFDLTATASSGLPVQFASSNSKVATVLNGKIHLIGAGSCDIIAFQDGDLNYNPAVSVLQKLTVQKGNQTISFPALSAKVLSDPDFSPGASASSGLALTYISSNPAVAAIVNGQVQIKGAGSAILTAKQAGNVNYNPASEVSQELTVTFKTGVENISGENDFQLYPNPVSDFLGIKLFSKVSTITIYNSVGSLVYKHSDSGSELRIPVSQIGGNGIYFIQVNSTIKKFVVTN
jgi:hypothetical protein